MSTAPNNFTYRFLDNFRVIVFIVFLVFTHCSKEQKPGCRLNIFNIVIYSHIQKCWRISMANSTQLNSPSTVFHDMHTKNNNWQILSNSVKLFRFSELSLWSNCKFASKFWSKHYFASVHIVDYFFRLNMLLVTNASSKVESITIQNMSDFLFVIYLS